MGWRRTLISMQAAQRRATRETQRQQREEIQQAHRVRMAELDVQVAQHRLNVAQQVTAYWEYIRDIASLHKRIPMVWDWSTIIRLYQDLLIGRPGIQTQPKVV